MQDMGRPRPGDELRPVRCPACGHVVSQPESAPAVDDLTGRAPPTEGIRFHCRRCNTVFGLDEAATEET